MELTKQEKRYLLDLKKEFSQVQSLEQMQERYEWFSLASSVKKDDLVKEFMHSPEFCNDSGIDVPMNNNYWKNIALDELRNEYPNANIDILVRFLNDVRTEERTSTINVSQFGLDAKYPQELLSDNKYLVVVANAEYYQGGYAQAMHEGYIKDMAEEDMDHMPLAKKDLAVIKQMPEFYEEVAKDCINAFKNEYPAFKDVQIPFAAPIETEAAKSEYQVDGNIPLKQIKEMLHRGMDEFETQRRGHNDTWKEWRAVKGEWLDLAMEEDNLSDRAGWSVEACQKKVREAAQQAINAGIDKAAAKYSAKAIYAALQPKLDPDGFYLLHAAEKVTGFKVDMEYPVEDGLHHFEAQTGFGMMRYLEAAQFGERTFKQIAPGTEMLETYRINTDTFTFKSYYRAHTFAEALEGMKKSAALTCDFKEFLSAAAGIQNIEQTVGTAELTPLASPRDGWVDISEHLKEYALPCVDEEAAYYERYKTPDVDYRLYEKFTTPDAKVPDFPTPAPLPEPQNGAGKLLNIFTPARESARLQNDLKILIDNANVFREYTGILNESIVEMKSEIAQMREHTAQAMTEIKGGEHFQKWMKLNLRPELSALGLDPDSATMWDLTDKLGQFAPEAQANMQTEALEFAEQVMG